MSELLRRLRVLLRRERFDRDLEEEMRAHVEMQAEENEAAGMEADEARYAARRQFGNATVLHERSREAWVWSALERIGQDARYAVRGLRKSPAFTAVAVLSLGLGIGANVAIFSLFNALMLRMLPVSHPEQLVFVYRTGGWGKGLTSYPLYLALRDRRDLFDGFFARSSVMRARFGTGRAEFVSEEYVSGEYFQVLGVRPALGRLFTPDDNRALGAHPFAVLSYEFWRSRFGGDPSTIGRVIHVDEQPLTVIGIAQPRFTGVEPGRRADVWVPAVMSRRNVMSPGMHWVYLLGRRKPGVSDRQMQAGLDVAMRQYLTANYGSRPPGKWRDIAMAQGLEVRPGGIGVSLLRDQFEKPIAALLAVVALVLLVACANVAGLMLARSAARGREIALRLSLGASRARVLQQLVVESVLIAAAGGALGLAFATWGTRYLLLFLPASAMVQLDVSPDGTVLAFAAAAAALSVFVFGLLPGLRATAVDPAASLREGTRGVSGPMRLSLRKAFVVLQVALSVVVVVAAGLFARSLGKLYSVDPGFHNLNVLNLSVDYPLSYRPEDAAALERRFLARVETLPGVLGTSYGFPGPYQRGFWSSGFRIPGSDRTAREPGETAMQSVGRRYFEAIGTWLVSGRDFNRTDTAAAPKAAIVNEAFAREYFSGQDPVGRVLSFDDSTPEGGEPTYIVGVVRDMAHGGIRERPVPTVYVPASQADSSSRPVLLVRAAVPPETLVPALRRELASLDPSLAMIDVSSIRQQIDDSIYIDRLLAQVSGFFGALSLLLAGIGLYGLIAYSVTRRTSEIGIRMALGAGRRNVLWMVVREGLVLIAAGILIGVPVSLSAARFASNLLFGIGARDPFSIAGAAVVLLGAGAAAALVPARRAVRIEPTEALRYE